MNFKEAGVKNRLSDDEPESLNGIRKVCKRNSDENGSRGRFTYPDFNGYPHNKQQNSIVARN